MKYYAIKKGRKNDVIVTSWAECSDLTNKYQGAIYKGFKDIRDAEEYLKNPLHPNQKTICEANCEHKLDDLCIAPFIKIDKNGHCSNF